MLPPRTITVCNRQVGVDRVTGVERRWKPDYTGLRPHQCEGVDALIAHRHFGLFDDMRTGKSATTLRAFPPWARIRLAAPASVLDVWKRQEVPRWAPHLKVTFCDGTPRKPDEGEMILSSWDSLLAAEEGRTRIFAESMRDVYLVGDEIQKVMTHSAQRTERWRMLALQCGWVWGLSGTPMPGNPQQLWGVLVSLGVQNAFDIGMCDANGTVMGAHQTFLALCGGEPRWLYDRRTKTRVQRGWIWGTVSDEVRRIVQTISIRRLAKDILDLPPKQYQTIPCETPASLAEHLEEVRREAWEGIDPDELPPFERLSEGMVALARSKVEAAVRFARDAAESTPLLVFSAHVDPVLAFQDVKEASYVVGTEAGSRGRRTKTREEAIDEWKSGKTQILAMTIQTGGMGLNLSRAGGILFVDREYNPGDNDQAERRADEDGKKDPIMVWSMVSDHPLDQNLTRILCEKSRLREAIGV